MPPTATLSPSPSEFRRAVPDPTAAPPSRAPAPRAAAAERHALQGRRVAIVGASLGGLCLARLLQLRGAVVELHEASSASDPAWYRRTLSIEHERDLAALQGAELGPLFDRCCVRERVATRLVDPQGRRQRDGAVPARAALQWRIEYGLLRDLLLGALPPGTVQWGRRFSSLTAAADGSQRLNFANGSRAHADLVVGADGECSLLRPYATDHGLRYAGVTLIESQVALPELRVPRLALWLDRDRLAVRDADAALVVQRNSQRGLDLRLGLRVPRDWSQRGVDWTDSMQVRALLRQRLAHWDSKFLHLIDAAEPRFAARALLTSAPDRAWNERSGSTLLGAAARLAPSLLSDRKAFELHDAAELADALTAPRHGSIAAALADYERGLLTRAARDGRDAQRSLTALLPQGSVAGGAWRSLGRSLGAFAGRLLPR
ncbi:hypothetical protein [Lysobacter silvisoli]|uniref:FAD-binding domain-containing protein n=1 Tax=Lysobacter silvisoli TaxID=2293254 RepID=A0A371K292_9GAMM|nr:hypothetical protein [Lysobacter silvisoli]RDZ27992.1 hypothetical protein DX914_02240 [Lysobacter silvisoli]